MGSSENVRINMSSFFRLICQGRAAMLRLPQQWALPRGKPGRIGLRWLQKPGSLLDACLPNFGPWNGLKMRRDDKAQSDLRLCRWRETQARNAWRLLGGITCRREGSLRPEIVARR